MSNVSMIDGHIDETRMTDDVWIIANYENYIKDGCNNIEKELLNLAKRQKAEIEELRKGFTADMDYFASEYDTKIKTEAIKEFWEKLKDEQEYLIGEDDKFKPYVSCEDGDNLVKEMAERKEDEGK